MTGPLSAILGFGLFGVFCLAFTEKILPVPPSHVLLLFLGMTAAPDAATLAILLMVTTLDEPPLRLLLGRDVLKAMRDKIAAMSASIEEWKSVTKDVNFPTA